MRSSALVTAAVTSLWLWMLAAPGVAAQEVTPESTPEIREVKPNQAALGEEVKLTIVGKNFAPGVYVSFSTPMVHAVDTKRESATQLEVRVQVGKMAQPGAISLFVSNTASAVAEAPFTIVTQAGPTTAAPGPDLGASAPPQPAAPAPSSSSPAAQGAAPEVKRVDPSVAPRGGQLDVKVMGKNFAKGAKVAFSNPGIRVLETQVNRDTELVARVQIAANAAPGETNLFVINPDEQEAEAAWVISEEVKAGAPATPSSAPASAPPSTPQPASTGSKPAMAKPGAASLRYEVYNLADVGAILQARNKPKGTLSLEGGKLRFEESGKEVFAVAASDVKEIEVNTLGGFNTGTFHIILNSGQTYHFIAASLRPADSQSMVDSLRRAVK